MIRVSAHALEAWCILRCSSARTLDLAKSLTEAGFEAWAPADEGVAMTPSYVFARSSAIPALLHLARNPAQTFLVWDPEASRMVSKGHPHFRLMHSLDTHGEWALVRETQLQALRSIERRRKPRGIVKPIPVGAKVRFTQGGFAGLEGTVQCVTKKVATVAFQGFPVPVKVGCWLLSEQLDASGVVHVNDASSERAAKAA